MYTNQLISECANIRQSFMRVWEKQAKNTSQVHLTSMKSLRPSVFNKHISYNRPS